MYKVSKLPASVVATAQPMRMSLTLDLERAWENELRLGTFVYRFKVGFDDDDLEPAWIEGNQIEIEIRLDDTGRAVYFAKNLDTGKVIEKQMLDEAIEGVDGFTKHHNPYRGLREGPQLDKKVPGRQPVGPVDEEKCRFKCLFASHPLSLLNRKPLGLISCEWDAWMVYPNYAPIQPDGSLLFVPAKFDADGLKLPHIPQRMKREWLADGLQIFEASQNLLVFWNAIGAGATVPGHFHYQAIVLDGQPFAIQSQKVPMGREYAYLENYPIEGLAFPVHGAVDKAWGCLEALQEEDIPFNLIMLEETLYVIPRNKENEITEEFPFGVWGAIECASRLILSNLNNYRETERARVLSAYRKNSLSREAIKRVTGLA